MSYNLGCPSDILPILPQRTSSTMFTACCSVAICDDQKYCPACKREVVGVNASTPEEVGEIRWKNATRFWDRKTRIL